jgi:hypothetical protein
MQKASLSINIQQKWKVAKIIKTIPTPFWDGVLRYSWWYWFKQCHPNLFICQVKGLEGCKTQGLTQQSY